MARKMTQSEKYEYEHLLGLTGTYDKQILKKAYLKCVREWHPDLASRNGHTNEEASEMTKKINNAFVELSNLLVGSASTVACETAPGATDSQSTGASYATDQTTGARRTSTGTSASHATTGSRSTASSSSSSTRDTGSGRTTAAGAGKARGAATEAEENPYEAQPRGSMPRNMAAAMRYTRIVTSSSFIKWFVAGIGPHIVFAVAALVLLALLGVCISGLYGVGGILLMVRLLPFAIIYDIITGKGAEMVGSVADIWAVNKAVNSTK